MGCNCGGKKLPPRETSREVRRPAPSTQAANEPKGVNAPGYYWTGKTREADR